MVANNNLSVLPFYTSLDEQACKKPYAYGDIYPLYCKVGTLPTFQIYDIESGTTTIELYKAENDEYVGVISPVLGTLTVEGVRVLAHLETENENLYSGEGQYYIVVVRGTGRYYSDVFTAVADVSSYLKVEWWDEENFIMDGAVIAYDFNGTLFHNVVLLNTQLGKPEYEFEEEGEKRDGLFFPSKFISEKTYKFTFLANEPLCDVMRLARMSDHVKVTDRYGGVYNCDTFLMTPKWETQGNVASVEVEFQTNLVAKRIGRAFT